MTFQNFRNFSFMFHRLAQKINVHYENGEEKKLKEPIVNQSNPNISYQNVSGGQLETGQLTWISKLENVPKNTEIELENGEKYKTTGAGQDITAGLTYYPIQKNNERRGRDTDF